MVDTFRLEKYHRHSGPFLALDIRMGIVATKELEAKLNNQGLCSIVITENPPPFSYLIDETQMTSKCTIDKGKLSLENSLGPR